MGDAGQYIFQGLSNMGNSMANAWQQQNAKREEEQKQIKERAQRQSKLEAALDTMGVLPKEISKTRSLDELEGILAGVQEKTKLGIQTLQQKQLEQAVAEQQAQATRQKQFQDTLANATMSPLGGVRPDMSPDRLQQAVLEAAVQSGDQETVMKALHAQGQTGNIMPVQANVGGRNLIVNARSGAFQDVTPQAAPNIPPGMEALGATEDEKGRLSIRYGFPKAEGKALTQTEVGGIAALNQAEMDLNTLENIYNQLGPDYGGPISGRVKSAVMGGQNPNIASLENAITAATPNLARGVFREVGVLTDQDVARYKQLLPSPTDTQEVRTRKIKQLRDRIAQGRKEMVTSLKAAGRDVAGFNSGESNSRYESEETARAAGAKTGDVIELYDPAGATYRKARLK